MNKFSILAAAGIALLAGGQALAADHHCADDARAHAARLLAFHFADGDASQPEVNQGIDDTVKVLPPIKALVGKGKLDVLEVIGYVYRAEYRMHFIYAQIPDSCALMGQEIIELSDPY